MRTVLGLFLLCSFVVAGSAESGNFSVGQRELGPMVITELTIRQGMLSFRSDSGGCTDADSFIVDVVTETGFSATVPHHRLTIRRVRIDDCKSFLADGVLIEIDLEKDLGLTGSYSISVENPVHQVSTSSL